MSFETRHKKRHYDIYSSNSLLQWTASYLQFCDFFSRDVRFDAYTCVTHSDVYAVAVHYCSSGPAVIFVCTGCPTRYRTRHFFNNSYTNEDIATKFEQEYVRCVRNEQECVCSAPNSCDKEQRSASPFSATASFRRDSGHRACPM